MKRKAFLFIKRVLLLLIVVFLVAPLNTITVEAADDNPTLNIQWSFNNYTIDDKIGTFDPTAPPDFTYRPLKTGTTNKYHESSDNSTLYLNDDPAFTKNYVNLQYLESDNGQYIDTGYAPNQNTRLEYIFMPLETGKKYVGEEETDKNFSIYDSSGLYFSFGDSTIPSSSPATISANTKYYLNVGNPNFNIYQYDHEYSSNYNEPAIHSSSATTSDFQSTKNIYLFGTEGNYSKQKVYGVKIYEGSTLKKDFIPVMTLNIIPAEDTAKNEKILPGTPCIYDKVENKYYVSGSGSSFVAGPALVTFNGVQYGVVDYIETQVGSKSGTDGTIDLYPFINTDARFDGSQNFKISAKVKMESVSESSPQYLFCLGKQSGSTVFYDGICLYYDNNQKKIVAQYSYKDFDGNDKNIASKELFAFGNTAEFDIENNSGIITMYKDGTSPSDDVINGELTNIDTTTYKVIADNYVLQVDAQIGNSLFKGNLVDSPGDSDYPTKGSIYYFQTYNSINDGHKERLWANGGAPNTPSALYQADPNNYKAQDGKYDIQRDFIPVKVMSTGEYGLLDLASKKFYGNDQSTDGCITPPGFKSNDHAPTGEAALYTIVDNTTGNKDNWVSFHDYQWTAHKVGDYNTGIKLGNVGKALYATGKNGDLATYNNAIDNLTHDWHIEKDNITYIPPYPYDTSQISGYTGWYGLPDTDHHIVPVDSDKLFTVKQGHSLTYSGTLTTKGNPSTDDVIITYSLDGSNYFEVCDFNTNFETNLKTSGSDLTIYYKIEPTNRMKDFIIGESGSFQLHIMDPLPDPIIPRPGHYSIPDTGFTPISLFPLNPFLN